MLYSIFAFSSVFTCIFWAILLFSSNPEKKPSKRVMGVFMIIVALFYTAHAAYYSGDYLLYKYFDKVYLFTVLSIFPIYYIYMVGLTKDYVHQKKYLWHLSPAFMFTLLYIGFSFRVSSTEYESYVINFLHAKAIQPLSFSNKTDLLVIILLTARIVYFLQIIMYIILGLRLTKIWRTRIKESLSETAGRDLQLVGLLSVFATIFSIFGYFIDLFGQFFVPETSLLLLLPAFLFSPILFKMGQIAYHQDFTIRDLEDVEEKAELIENAVNQENPSKLRQGLEILMNEKKIFLVHDLKISTVCEKLHTNRTYLSQVLNEELKENFNSYINKYRVEYAISLFNDPKWNNYSLEKFAELSGFGSTISMIRAFKQITGKTPKEFRV